MLMCSTGALTGDWGLGYGMIAFVDCVNGAGDIQQRGIPQAARSPADRWGDHWTTGPGMARRFNVVMEEICLLIVTSLLSLFCPRSPHVSPFTQLSLWGVVLQHQAPLAPSVLVLQAGIHKCPGLGVGTICSAGPLLARPRKPRWAFGERDAKFLDLRSSTATPPIHHTHAAPRPRFPRNRAQRSDCRLSEPRTV